ncbi:hypothetical protein ACF0H5_018855 [Mactra antiquata]
MDDDLQETTQPHPTTTEQHRLMEANLALQNDNEPCEVTSDFEDKYILTNGAADSKLKKNNNNGEVRFDLGVGLERETVL